jgi:hypothetical protein
VLSEVSEMSDARVSRIGASPYAWRWSPLSAQCDLDYTLGFFATILQFKSAILAFSASVHAWPPL